MGPLLGRIPVLLESNVLLPCRDPGKTFVVYVLGVRVLDLIDQVACLVLLDAKLLAAPSVVGTQGTGRPCSLHGVV